VHILQPEATQRGLNLAAETSGLRTVPRGVRFFVLPCRWFAGHAMRKHCDRTGIPEATSLLVWVKHADSARPNQSHLCVNNEAGRS
jgi:hypothetical protein